MWRRRDDKGRQQQPQQQSESERADEFLHGLMIDSQRAAAAAAAAPPAAHVSSAGDKRESSKPADVDDESAAWWRGLVAESTHGGLLRYEALPDVSPDVATLLAKFHRLLAADSWAEHVAAAATALAPDATLDTPLFLTLKSREQAARVLYYVHRLMGADIKPLLVVVCPPHTYRSSGSASAAVSARGVRVYGVAHLIPRRSWLLPLTMLLPADVRVHVTLDLAATTDGSNTLLAVRNRPHNWPALPSLVRRGVSLLFGGLLGAWLQLDIPQTA